MAINLVEEYKKKLGGIQNTLSSSLSQPIQAVKNKLQQAELARINYNRENEKGEVYKRLLSNPITRYTAEPVGQIASEYAQSAIDVLKSSPPGQVIQGLSGKGPTVGQGLSTLRIPFAAANAGASAAFRLFPGVYGALQGPQGVSNAITKYAGPSTLAQNIPKVGQYLAPGTTGGNVLDSAEMVAGLLGKGVDDTVLGLIKGKTKIPNAKGMVFGKNRNTSWPSQEASVLSDSLADLYDNQRKLNDIFMQNKKPKSPYEFQKARELLSSIEDRMAQLADNHIPNDTLKKLAKDYGNNTVGYLKALGDELQKSLKKYEDKGGIVLGIYGGPQARNFPKNRQGTFSSMADKKVRFEIDDSKTNFLTDWSKKARNITTLDRVIDHPTLFKQYPELKKLNVYLGETMDGKSSGQYSPPRINPRTGKTDPGGIVVDGFGKSDEEIKSTLLHEIQHAIQEKEGFARGGSPAQFQGQNQIKELITQQQKDFGGGFQNWMDNLLFTDRAKHKRLLQAGEKNADLTPFYEEYAKTLPADERSFFVFKMKDFDKQLSQARSYSDPMNAYQRLSGEVEARDVQSRMNLTPEQRRTTLPFQSQGIPLKDQIVRFDGGTQASVKNREYNKLTNDLIESYANGEEQIKKLEELQSVVDAQENPKKFRQLADEIAKVETGNRSAIKQLAQHHNVSDYDILDAITTYIDAGARRGKRTVEDFYKFLPEESNTMASISPQQSRVTAQSPLRKARPGSYTNVPEIDNPLAKRNTQGFEAEMDQMVQSRPPVDLQRPNNVEKINQSEARKMAQDAMVSIEGNKDEYVGVLKKYFGESESAQTKAVRQAASLTLPKEVKGMDVVNAIEGTGPVPKGSEEYIKKFRELDTEVFEAAKAAGIDIRFLKDHITHFWANTPEQVQEAYLKFGRTYSGAKKRQIPTYQEGIEILGLTPKYTDPKQILAESIRRLEKAKAGINAFNELKKLNLVVPASVGSTMPGFEAIRAPGFPQNFSAIDDNMALAGQWYAPKELASAINKAFSPQETTGLAGALNKTGKLSGIIQDLSLSGGIPGTPVNAFTIANIQKEVLGGRPIQAAQAFIRSFSDKASREYFTKKADVIIRMQENDIAVNSNLSIEDLAPIGFAGGGKQAISSLIKRDFGQAREGIKAAWESAMGNATFKRFLPMLQVQFFEDIERQAMKAGKGQQEASQVAAMALKKWSGASGIYKQKTADKLTQDAVKTFFFAPKFREAMINFWINNAKAISPVKLDQGKVKLNNPLSLENRANTTFVAASIATYLMMDQINYALNGKHMNENPSGTEDKLLIPTDNGDVIGVPFLSSIATVPRGIYRVGKQIASGNIEAGVKDAVSTFGSQPVKTLSDISRNEDYFGKPITKDSQTPIEKFQNIASYAIGNNAHPYYKELTDPRNTEDPAYQRISRAAEAPLRFYTKDSLKDKEYFGARDKYLSKNEAGFYPQKASTLRDELQSGEITKEQMESRMQEIAREERVRNKVKETGESFQDGDIYGIMRNGKVSIINLSNIEKPQLTGDAEIDSIVQKEYATKLSNRVNDIADLYRSNKITKEDAQQKIRDIELERYKTQIQSGNKSPTKPRTITDILNAREESDLESQENQAIKEYKQGKVSSQDLSSKLKTIRVKKLKYKKPKKLKVKGYKLKKVKLKQARKPKKIKLTKVKRSGSLG